MKIAVIGAGTIGKIHLESYKKMSKHNIIIFDADQSQAKDAANQFDFDWTASFDDILNSDVEIIDICLPTFLHEEYTIKAAEAKKHVFCEKPIANNVEAAKRMLKICKENNVKLGIGMVVRFFPEYQAVKESYQEGIIGKAGIINSFRGGGGYPIGWNDWYANDELSGSIVVDLLIHDIDYIQSVFGKVKSVYASNNCSNKNNEKKFAVFSAMLRLENNILAQIDASWYDEGNFHTKFEVAGNKGIIDIKPELSTPIKTKLFVSDNDKVNVSVPESPLKESPYYLEIKDFIEAVKKDREPAVNAEEAISALFVAKRLMQSVREKRIVKVGEVRN